MADYFVEEFVGTAATPLHGLTPEVGSTWTNSSDNPAYGPVLDGAGYCKQDPAGTTIWSINSTDLGVSSFNLYLRFKIVGIGAALNNGFDIRLSVGHDGGSYIDEPSFALRVTGQWNAETVYVAASTTWLGDGLTYSDNLTLPVGEDITLRLELTSGNWHNFYVNAELKDSFSHPSSPPDTFNRIEFRIDDDGLDPSDESSVLVEEIRITSDVLYEGTTDVLTQAEIAAAPFKCFADALVDDVPIRIPISSWQATLRNDGSNYAQIVVPTASAWADTLADATEIIITYALCDDAGTVTDELEVCRFPVQTTSYAQGVRNDTVTVSGYWDGYEYNADPAVETDRDLIGVQQVFSTTNTLRYRCKLDPLLRPSVRAYPDGYTAILVTYVNFYVGGQGAFMDVGGVSRTTYTGTAASVGTAQGAAVPLALVTGTGTSVGAGSAAAVDAT